MLGWFLYFRIALSTGSWLFQTSHNKSSLILKFFDYITKKVLSFLAISMSEEMMLLLSTSVMVSFAVTFSGKSGLAFFQNFWL